MNIAVNMEDCLEYDCYESCSNDACIACLPCVNKSNLFHMREAHREHLHQGNFIRVFPTSMHFNDRNLISSMTETNRISINWFEGKCNADENWC
jgi:hypothetical protein